ncbi:MAG: type IV pili methyl-accepting chemotaxis transducer N-terminal domain-containing protein [Deltaproteobacteria bacterium]|nr:type IV pili methyl-accepting chemotaxis transducer N-terminal domain-containing protein [Deltaproteobacteria bacterium]MBW2362087.1 type IV pili methyl-accepting chemotaxis transducer N-terminal domain-containing protein [Deltaproteobacteria bacterium]
MVVRCLTSLVLLVAPLLAVGAAPDPGFVSLQRWEHGGAQIQLSRVRTLTQRLSKQNLLYQLRLAALRKRDLIRTAEEMDAALLALRKGSPSLGIPSPPTGAVRAAIDSLDRAWGPLRRLAMASVFDYALSSGGAGDGGGMDPLLVRHFDELAEVVDRRAAMAQQRYLRVCERSGVPDCIGVVQATRSGMLSERLVKQAVLVFAGFDAEANTVRLRESRESMRRVLEAAEAQEPVQSAMSSQRGKIGDIVGGLWRGIRGHWERLSGDVDVVLAGQSQQLDVGETLAVQRLFLDDLTRFSVAVRRFSAVRRAGGTGRL